MTISYGPLLYYNNLILWYDFASARSYTSGNTVNDLSGSANTGTFSAATTVGGGYAQFAGTTNITNITTTTQFNNPQVFSLSIWFNTTSTTGKKLVGFETNQTSLVGGNYDRQYIVDTTGNLYYAIYTGALTTYSYGTANTGNWYNAVVSTNNGSINHYLNGVLIGSSSGTAQNLVGWWRIGGYRTQAWPNTNDGYFTGNVGPVMIWNTALTTAQVTQTYNAIKGRFGL